MFSGRIKFQISDSLVQSLYKFLCFYSTYGNYEEITSTDNLFMNILHFLYSNVFYGIRCYTANCFIWMIIENIIPDGPLQQGFWRIQNVLNPLFISIKNVLHDIFSKFRVKEAIHKHIHHPVKILFHAIHVKNRPKCTAILVNGNSIFILHLISCFH